jgi:hemolysin activation/secretion protein
LQTARLERTTQLLQDVPGVAIAEPPQFAPGGETGDVRVVFSLEPSGKPVQGSVAVDNKGIPTTGRYRFGFSVSGNNVFGAGESYGLSLTGTNEGMWTGSLTASMPIFDDGLRVAAGITRQEYTVNSIARLTGVANIAQLGLVYPIARGLDRNVWVGASYLHSKTKSSFDEFSVASRATIDAARISLQANNGDRPRQLRTNVWNGELALTYGHQSNDSPLLDQAANIGGNYFKLAGSGFGTYGLNRSGDVFVSGRVNAQIPNRNLDPSEKLIVGGPDAVRAYRPDEGSMDEGIVLNLGLYKRWSFAAGHQLQAGVFNDFAFGRVNHSPWPNWELSFVGVPGVSNRRLLGGYGLGVDWLTPIGVLFSASVSKAYGFSSPSWVEPGKKPVQYWLSVSWSM